MPDLPKNLAHPCIACTPEELARLQAAWKATGPAHDLVAARVKAADAALKDPLSFPPRGGQHNQWYQCDKCQVALETVDPTHHRCPKCGTVYSGEPYDDVIFERRHYQNIRRMRDAAWAYAVSGQAKYAEFAAKVLLGYAERYSQYPYHDAGRSARLDKVTSGGHLFEQTLNEASALATDIAPAYDLVYNALSENDRATVAAGLLRPMLDNISRHKAGKSNWQTWHNAGLFAGAAVLGDSDLARRTIADPANGFLFQMEACVSSDGMWYENSWGYHFYTLSALVSHAESARRVGIDLWSAPALRKMFLLPAQYAMADGSLPRFGDDVQTSAAPAAPLIEPAVLALKDPALLPLLPEKATWESVLCGRDVKPRPARPALQSAVFTGAGHAILRTDGPAGLTAAFTFGPYGGFHGHLDKLSFVLFGFGRELAVDPGRAASQAYRLPIHTRWYKATISHNAVLVGHAAQQPASGKLIAFASTTSFAVAAAECTAAYKDVTHRRLLCLTPEYLIALDDLDAPDERDFDWFCHVRAKGVRCQAADADSAPRDSCPGEEYLQHVKSGTTDGLLRAVFEDDRVDTHLAVTPAPGTSVRTADGVGASVNDRVPVITVSRRGRSVQFTAVIEPVQKPAAPQVREVTLVRNGRDLTATVAAGKTDVLTWTDAGRITLSRDGKQVLCGEPQREARP